MTALNFAEIRDLLPHRFPISMVDRVHSMEPGYSLIASKCITSNEPCYRTLRDGVPQRQCAYPQSLLIESFLQAAGLLFLCSVVLPGDPTEYVMLFGSITECEFPGDAFPGDQVEHRVRTDRVLTDSAILTGESWVGDQMIARYGQAVVAIRPSRVLNTDCGS